MSRNGEMRVQPAVQHQTRDAIDGDMSVTNNENIEGVLILYREVSSRRQLVLLLLNCGVHHLGTEGV